MHEYSIMAQVVNTILSEAKKNNLIKVSKVTLEVGELAFLNPDALKFSYNALIKDTSLSSSELIIESIKPEIECTKCKYNGDLEYLEKDEFHFTIPKFSCPKCGSGVSIVRGRDCIIKDISGEVE